MSQGPNEPRYIPPGACPWCGHPPHVTHCLKTIRKSKDELTATCPCRAHEQPK